MYEMKDLKDFPLSKRFDHVPVIGSAYSEAHPDLIPLNYGLPFPDAFPIDELERAAITALRTEGTEALNYSGGPGQITIREWIKERSKLRSIETSADNVLITTGSNQGIDLVARTLTDPGDHVWVEAPTYFGALRAFRLAKTKLSSFPIDASGLCVDLVEEALIEAERNSRPLPKFIYVLPTYQNPSGINLSTERKKKLAELAYKYNFFIVEDDAYVELKFKGDFQPAIYAFAPERVIYLSTCSKIIAPGIRMGWAIGPEDILNKIRLLKSDGLTSVFIQEIISNYLKNTDFDAHLKKLVAGYRLRSEAMIQAVHDCFHGEVTCTEPGGGFFLWLTFPEGADTSELLQDAAKEGVSYVEGRHFYLNNRPNHHLRLSFSFCSPEAIERGIRRLAAVYFRMKDKNKIMEKM